MIRLRDRAGNATELQEYRFVELCDQEKQLALLAFVRDDGTTCLLTPDDEAFQRYCTRNGITPSRAIAIEN